jgi:hypothetical protein
MTTDRETRPGRWHRSANDDWTADEQVYAALLDHLSRDLAETEAAQLEMDARPRRGMADVLEDEQRLQEEQRAAARAELIAFSEALRDARVRAGADQRAEVAYDAADRYQNGQADLLIQYLVRPGYAEVRTEEPRPGQHVYYFQIDWERLHALASERGHTLSF